MFFTLLLVSLGLTACSNVNEDERVYPLENRPALVVSDSCPLEGQEDVSIEAVIRVRFNKALDPSTVTERNILLGSGRYHVKGTVIYDDRLVTYIPVEPLYSETDYALYISSAVRDEDGFSSSPDYVVLRFMTGDPGVSTCRWVE